MGTKSTAHPRPNVRARIVERKGHLLANNTQRANRQESTSSLGNNFSFSNGDQIVVNVKRVPTGPIKGMRIPRARPPQGVAS
jgi:hypothetical protein